MNSEISVIQRKKIVLVLDGRTGMDAFLYFYSQMLVMSGLAAAWVAFTVISTGCCVLLFHAHILSIEQAYIVASILSFGVASLLGWYCAFVPPSQNKLFKCANLIDRYIITQLFHQKFFFPASSGIRYFQSHDYYKNTFVSYIYVPPRNSLA